MQTGEGALSAGRVGRLLRVDLTTGRMSVEDTGAYADYLGGAGMAARIYFGEVEPGVGPLDPGNPLIFMTGPFTGTPVPASGRSSFYSKSPVGHPRPVCRPSSIGGALGSQLKYAGFDGLIIQGASPRPVYLWIEDGAAEILDAAELWGLDTFETQKALLGRHDARGSVAAIGPSGENLGRMASIVHGTGFASGLAGFGAVMGSKRLKAFGVRGAGGVEVAHPARLLEAVKRARGLMYDVDDPPRMTGMRGLGGDYPGGDEFMARYSVGVLACQGCPCACQGVFRVPGTPVGADCCVWPHSMAVGFTEGCDGWKAAWEVNSLVNRLGLSTYEIHQSFQFVNHLREAGLIDERSTGLPLGGDPRDLVKALAHQIAYRQGMGDLLAEGLPRAAAKIGGEASRFVIDVRGWPILMPWDDPRLHALLALLPSTGGHFPYNDPWMFWAVYRGAYNLPVKGPRLTVSDADVRMVARRVFGDERAADGDVIRGKAVTVLGGQNDRMLGDALGFCAWMSPVDVSFYDKELRGDRSVLAEFYAALTGDAVDDDALVVFSERIHAIERLQGIKHGYASRELDLGALSARMFVEPHEQSPLPGHVVDADQLRVELDRYYELRGWDPVTGIPLAAELRRLGMDDVLAQMDLGGGVRTGESGDVRPV